MPTLYESLPPETRTLIDVLEEAAWKFGMARDDHNRIALELAREDMLAALRDDFRHAQTASDEAAAHLYRDDP